MRDFLNEYITSLSGKRQTSIYDVLSAARVSKSDLDTLAKKLADKKAEAPIVIRPESYGDQIRAASFDAAYRDVYRRTLELYEVSNLISLLLDTHGSVLTSEIKALEDELLAMEKAINNYAFTLSDNGFYDYAFTEPFNDDTMLETDPSVVLSDRSGIDFEVTEIASVNSASGILTLSPTLEINHALTGNIINNNCLALVTSDTGIENALNATASTGWRVAISAPKPITSSLYDTKQGAQVEAEMLLASASPCDTLILTPFADVPIEILRIQIYPDANNNSPTTILSTPTLLDRPFNINFPLQSIFKFRILINQSVYRRGSMPPVKEQVTYRDFYSELKQDRKDVAEYTGKSYLKNKSALKRVFLNTQRQTVDMKIFKAEIPEVDFEALRGPVTINRLMNRTATFGTDADIWNYKSKTTTFMRRMIDERIFANNPELLNDRYIYNSGSAFLNRMTPMRQQMVSGASQEYPRMAGAQAALDADILSYAKVQEDEYLSYQYNLGLRNIQIGTGIRVFRGVFITKQLPAPSDSGEVKLKVDHTNFDILDTSRDSTLITSAEYSISNKSSPKTEADWLPIQPIDDLNVEAERMFMDTTGTGYFRFPVAQDGDLEIYKNGYIVSLDQVKFFKNSAGTAITGMQVPMNSFLVTDIFTVTYTPFDNQKIINFVQKGFGQSLLASAYDDAGAGETFPNTYNNQIITLANDPFVNYDLVNSNGIYSPTLGFTGAYQPITIVMSDGTVALNQTNYVGISQNNLSDFPETKTAYIHSGKNIVFNKPIDSTFTVYYQYLPSNLRLRIVLRVNDINYVSPTVNSVQIKTKTLKANARKPL